MKHSADVVVYGGTAAGIVAAVHAARMGKRVCLVTPETRLGGMTTGGLGFTDTGNTRAIGGMALEFYKRLYAYYMKDSSWPWEKRDDFANEGQATPALDHARGAMWIFEPSAALTVLDEWLAECDVRVCRDEWLDRGAGVSISNAKIEEIRTLSGLTIGADVFIDATYEGDLMAAANVSCVLGREANSVYAEEWNGVQVGAMHHGHFFAEPVDPYLEAGNPASGLLPHISDWTPPPNGTGDALMQAYNYRVCMTNHEPNRISFPKPAGYQADDYELLLRVYATGWGQTFDKFDRIPNRKTDTNNHGPFSSDFIGASHRYPSARYVERRQIIEAHRQYQQGLLYFMQNDTRMPGDVRDAMQQWGLAGDEFEETGHWPHQLYVREARRLVGEAVITENEVLKGRPVEQSVGLGSYAADSHNVSRFVTADGCVQNEGDIGRHPHAPYGIPYGAIIPKRNECRNLLVPVCCSASHTAFGSVRMEPVFMILAQSAATAAVLASDGGMPVQDVNYETLRRCLIGDGQLLDSDSE